MPLPLAPLVPLALRLGVVAAASYALRRVLAARPQVGRRDQRAEDALDDLGDGIATHRTATQGATGDEDRQSNAAARFHRVISFRGHSYEIDASALARLIIRKV